MDPIVRTLDLQQMQYIFIKIKLILVIFMQFALFVNHKSF